MTEDTATPMPFGKNLGFHHAIRDSIAVLCDKVDAAGGWNPQAVCVQFYHGIEDRHCIFSNQNVNTAWWTTVLTRDEYYWHRISDAKKAKIRRDIVNEIRSQIA
jgi:hypothetical protein